MRLSDKVKLQMSKSRQKLAELAAIDEPNDEQRAERDKLTEEYPDLEKRYQAAVVSEDAEEVEEPGAVRVDAEEREAGRIMLRSSFGRYVDAVVRERSLDGAESELNAALEVETGRVPLAMLLDGWTDDRIEDRADSATALSVDTIKRPSMWLSRVFAQTGSAHLGVRRRMVPSGVAAYPVITSGASALTVAKAAAKNAEVFALTVNEAKPKRISARYQISHEDLHRLGPGEYENALRADLRATMAESMDKEIIAGGTGISGLNADLTRTKLDGTTDAAISNASTAAAVQGALLGVIDGRYATKPGDIKVLTHAKAVVWSMSAALTIGTTDSIFLSEYLSGVGIQCLGSPHVKSPATNEYSLFVSMAMGLSGAAVHSVWDSVRLIRDEVTGAGTGHIAITAIGEHDFEVMRTANFKHFRIATA